MARRAHRVVIVGGGFAGVYAAAYLSRSELRDDGVEITLIDPKNYFTFTPLLAEVTAGTLGREHVTHPYHELARRNRFRFVYGAVEYIDRKNGTVHLADDVLTYDYLVLASGAEPQFFGNEIIEQGAFPFVSVSHALQIRGRLISAMERAMASRDEDRKRRLLTFVVAGGGPAGVEIASEIFHLAHEVLCPYYPVADMVRVVLAVAGGRILVGFDEELAAEGLAKMRERGIEVLLDTFVAGLRKGAVEIRRGEDASVIESETLVWTAGTAPGKWLAAQDLPLERGAVRTDSYLRIEGSEHEFAVGDVCLRIDERTGGPFPRVAPIAISQGVRAAANIENHALGRPMERYEAFHAGKIVSFGGGFAIAEVLGIKLTGRLAWYTYRGVYLLKLVGLRNKVKVLVTLLMNKLFGPNISYEESRTGFESTIRSRGSTA